MPSGGASGEVILPEYLIFQQANWLNNIEPESAGGYTTTYGTNYSDHTFNVRNEMELSADLNPYTGIAAYDPDPVLSETEDRLTDFVDEADAIDPSTLLVDSIAAAIDEVDSTFLSEDTISDSVAAFEASTDAVFLRSAGRAAASLQAGRAVMTTLYDARISEDELDRRATIAQYEAQLRLTVHGQRMQLAQYFAGQYVDLVRLQLTSLQIATTLTADISKLRIAAMQDQIAADNAYDVNEANWRLDRFAYGNSVVSAYSGGGSVPRPPTTGERVMQNVLTAVSAGISGGQASKSPELGFGIGVVTLLSGIFSSFLK